MATEGKRKAAAKAMQAATPTPVVADAAQPALLPELGPDEARGPGRPAGALSKKTRDFLAYLEAMPNLELPGVWLAKRYMRSAREICEEAGLPATAENLRWADDQRQDAAKALAPYVHERRPIGVSITDKRTIELVVREGEPLADASRDGAGGLRPLGSTAAAIVLDVIGEDHDA